MNEWQPIETAPKEKNSVVIICARDGVVVEVGEAYLSGDGNWYWAGSHCGYHDPIQEMGYVLANWMKLPEPPL